MALVAYGTGVLIWLTMYEKLGSMRFLVSILVLTRSTVLTLL